MNLLRSFAWLLVILAAIATAVAAGAAFMPPAVLADLGPDPAGPAAQIVHFDALACDQRCSDVENRLEEEFPSHVWEPRLQRVSPPSGDPGPRFEPLLGLERPAPPAGTIALPTLGEIGEWSLTGTDGKPYGSRDLAGKTWIADFMFTSCSGPCPMMNDAMKKLVGRLPDHPGLRFVSFSVDPQRDTPEALKSLADDLEAPDRWKFLTGTAVYNLAEFKFKLGVRPNPGADPGNAVMHSTRFTLVDGRGRIRGTYSYDYDQPDLIPAMMDRLVRDARALLETPDKVVDASHDARRFLVDVEGKVRGAFEPDRTDALVRSARRWAPPPMLGPSLQRPAIIRQLPAVNAGLNTASFCFLSLGLAFILKRRIGLHKACMTAALAISALFLASYLTYHFNVGSVKYTGVGGMRIAYFAVLISHTILAAAVAPMALVTVVRAWRGRFDRHVALARWTLPVWMYVSLTGILVYLLLYRLV